jgi:hypothetical protein
MKLFTKTVAVMASVVSLSSCSQNTPEEVFTSYIDQGKNIETVSDVENLLENVKISKERNIRDT